MKRKKNLYKYYATRKRDWIEAWCDLNNRKFELVRTIGSILGFILQCVILLKVTGHI